MLFFSKYKKAYDDSNITIKNLNLILYITNNNFSLIYMKKL